MSPLDVTIASQETSQTSRMETTQPPELPLLCRPDFRNSWALRTRWNPQMLSCLQIRPYVTVKCPDWYFLISSVSPAPLALSGPHLRSSSDFWGSKGFWQRIRTTMKSNSCDRPASSVSESEIMVYNKLIKQISCQTSLVLYAFIHESSLQLAHI